MRFSAATCAAFLLATSTSHAFTPTLRTCRAVPSSPFALYSTVVGSEITMPALSSTMKEGRVVSWLKNEGDEIEAGEAIMVVESDKADMDVEAFEDGFLAKILVGEGEMAPVGEAVALVAASEDEIDSVAASGGSAAAPAEAPAAEASSGGMSCVKE